MSIKTRIPQSISAVKKAINENLSRPISRRNFLRNSKEMLLAASLVPYINQPRLNHLKRKPKIAVVGAGLAGLTAAYYLQRSGLSPEIYEAQNRVSGRIISAQNLVANGITTELGGEFIDSTHVDILSFCRKFNLPLLDMKAESESRLINHDYYIGGRHYTEKEIIGYFAPFAGQIKQDVASLPENMDYRNPSLVSLDRMSIDEYLHKIGIYGWLFDLLTTSFTSELGLPSGEQSSLNLLVSLSSDTTKGFEIYGDSDERYKVLGGNQRITEALQKQLQRDVQTEHRLVRLASKGSGYQLSFENGREVHADIVILTLPFSVLRSVELKIDMPVRKRLCIDELGYGTQSKLFIGVKERIWREQGYSGYVLSDQIHNGWDSSQMQNHNTGPGGYSLFLGADKGKNLSLNQYEYYLNQSDKVFPGIAQAADRERKGFYNWNQNPMTKGAYACYKIGQFSRIGQAEAQPIGKIFFAGEHCSENFQGFMNGAAETGRKAAENVINLVK